MERTIKTEAQIRAEVEAEQKEVRETYESMGMPSFLASIEANTVLLRELREELVGCLHG